MPTETRAAEAHVPDPTYQRGYTDGVDAAVQLLNMTLDGKPSPGVPWRHAGLQALRERLSPARVADAFTAAVDRLVREAQQDAARGVVDSSREFDAARDEVLRLAAGRLLVAFAVAESCDTAARALAAGAGRGEVGNG